MVSTEILLNLLHSVDFVQSNSTQNANNFVARAKNFVKEVVAGAQALVNPQFEMNYAVA